MASPVPDVATGITVTFGTSSWTPRIRDMQPPGPYERQSLRTSYQSTSEAHTFTPGDLVDYGSVNITGWFNPDDDIPITAVPETITIVYPGGAVQSFSGFLTSFAPGQAALDDLMEFSATIKVSGAVQTVDAGTATPTPTPTPTA